ncbi:MAG: hypothetical protein APF76_18100 [Desulfitibacter sp. BRH_c19]|nr:MAG: hypothetical protein APF76_18100 [Desulfitibacter sp. BRH_c19]
MKSNRDWLLGALIVGAGIIMLLHNFRLIDFSVGYIVFNYWPAILILWGLQFLTKNRGRGELFTGLVLIILGSFILGEKHGLIELDLTIIWKTFWPLIIILLGVSLLRGPKKTVGKSNLAFMGGLERKKEAWTLEDGNYWAVMGALS